MFTQCPPVDVNNGCQFLITINSGTETVTQDPNEGPYEGADDSLIGVQNNSSSPVSALPLSVPGSELFGFDEDGICNPGAAPLLSGCVPQAGAPAGTVCGDQNDNCAFPRARRGARGLRRAGRQHPASRRTATRVRRAGSRTSPPTRPPDVVHFSPAIPPGGSTYFSLEEPPTNTNIGVGGTAPLSSGMSPPTVTSTGAAFSALVNPNGQATTAFFQYGLDLKYSKLGGSGPTYTNSTPVQALAGDFNDHFVISSVSGLVPNALYHVRLVATNGAAPRSGLT